ncbi:MAG: hypothetical protein UU47_C0002G0001 [candidate division TM6 bacterium GW2011_GWE2_41_16]|nr:MAG: hypothetical protein UU47_C0002G0001 [candidate division TM6 bacterium GW2011_GWE2_41_16]
MIMQDKIKLAGICIIISISCTCTAMEQQLIQQQIAQLTQQNFLENFESTRAKKPQPKIHLDSLYRTLDTMVCNTFISTIRATTAFDTDPSDIKIHKDHLIYVCSHFYDALKTLYIDHKFLADPENIQTQLDQLKQQVTTAQTSQDIIAAARAHYACMQNLSQQPIVKHRLISFDFVPLAIAQLSPKIPILGEEILETIKRELSSMAENQTQMLAHYMNRSFDTIEETNTFFASHITSLESYIKKTLSRLDSYASWLEENQKPQITKINIALSTVKQQTTETLTSMHEQIQRYTVPQESYSCIRNNLTNLLTCIITEKTNKTPQELYATVLNKSENFLSQLDRIEELLNTTCSQNPHDILANLTLDTVHDIMHVLSSTRTSATIFTDRINMHLVDGTMATLPLMPKSMQQTVAQEFLTCIGQKIEEHQQKLTHTIQDLTTQEQQHMLLLTQNFQETLQQKRELELKFELFDQQNHGLETKITDTQKEIDANEPWVEIYKEEMREKLTDPYAIIKIPLSVFDPLSPYRYAKKQYWTAERTIREKKSLLALLLFKKNRAAEETVNNIEIYGRNLKTVMDKLARIEKQLAIFGIQKQPEAAQTTTTQPTQPSREAFSPSDTLLLSLGAYQPTLKLRPARGPDQEFGGQATTTSLQSPALAVLPDSPANTNNPASVEHRGAPSMPAPVEKESTNSPHVKSL